MPNVRTPSASRNRSERIGPLRPDRSRCTNAPITPIFRMAIGRVAVMISPIRVFNSVQDVNRRFQLRSASLSHAANCRAVTKRSCQRVISLRRSTSIMLNIVHDAPQAACAAPDPPPHRYPARRRGSQSVLAPTHEPSGKLREDQHARILGILRGDVFLGALVQQGRMNEGSRAAV
jgi:hypothetical protein